MQGLPPLLAFWVGYVLFTVNYYSRRHHYYLLLFLRSLQRACGYSFATKAPPRPHLPFQVVVYLLLENENKQQIALEGAGSPRGRAAGTAAEQPSEKRAHYVSQSHPLTNRPTCRGIATCTVS
jgi:hypothetical protein